MGLFDGTTLERPVLCERCQLELRSCHCPPLDTPPEKQQFKIRLDKRKRGKIVTVISGFHCSERQMQELLSYFKTHCGAGGCIDASSIELQGDHTIRIVDILGKHGYRIDSRRH